MNETAPEDRPTQRPRRLTLRGGRLITAVIVAAVLVLAAVYFAWAWLLVQGPRRAPASDPPVPAQGAP